MNKFKCPTVEFYTNKHLLSSIQLLLDLPDVVYRKSGTTYDSAFGNILTSVGNDYSDVVTLPGAEQLVSWITTKLLEINPTAKEVQYKKSWANMMFRGSEGLVHSHIHPDFIQIIPDFVAIFYIQVPQDGANLIFVNNGKFNTHYYEYDASQRHEILCESGDLIIHSPELFHSVGIHNSDIPRICLVFEGNYIV